MRKGNSGLPRPALGYPSLTKMCLALDIDRSTWIKYEKRYPDLSEEERLELCKRAKLKGNGVGKRIFGYESLKDMCKAEGIKYNTWRSYRARFPMLTDKELLTGIKEGTLDHSQSKYTKRKYKPAPEPVKPKRVRPGFYVI